MTYWRKLLSLLPSRRAAQDRDMQEELESLKAIAEKNELGNLTLVAENARGTWTVVWIEQLLQDLRYALRTLRRNPGFTVVVILTLALAIGMSTSVFSVLNAVLLRPVSYPDGNRLMWVTTFDKQWDEEWVSAWDFRNWQEHAHSFDALVGYETIDFRMPTDGDSISTRVALVSHGFWKVSGVRPALGRLPLEGEENVLVLSSGMFERWLQSDPAVIGKAIDVEGRAQTVIGILPKEFLFEFPAFFPGFGDRDIDIYRPPQSYGNGRGVLTVVGRLKPDVSIDRARAELAEIRARVSADNPRREAAEMELRVIPLLEKRTGRVYTAVWILFGAVLFVLLIACANIANLLLARGVARAGEFAVRLSLGARREQLIAQLMIESCILAVAGGAAGLFVARWMLDIVRTTLPSEAGTHLRFEADLPLLAFGFALSLFTALLFGMLPAIHSTRIRVATMAKSQGGVTSTGASSPLRSALVTSQIALALALLVVAGLFAKSLVNISRIDLGMQISNLTTFRVSPALNGYSDEREHALFEQIADELAAVPGVSSVSESSVALLSGSNASANVTVRGFEADPDADLDASTTLIGPRFFATLGIPLIVGREFTRGDTSTSQSVAIVNEAFAKKFNLARDAVVGTRMELGRNSRPKFEIEIVGLVQNAKYSGAKDDTPPMFYLPHRQRETVRSVNYYVRSSLDTGAMSAAVSRIVAKLDSNLPIEELRTMEAQVRERSASDLLLAKIAMSFAGLATLLAAVGLYGVLAYSVAQRTPEIGVRLALGADAARIRQMILRHVGQLAIMGVAVGLAGALVLGRYAASLLFRVEGMDPTVMLAAVAVVIFVSLGAAMVPAYRASRIDPARALRWE
jgi:putative ABC transport system permease protein